MVTPDSTSSAPNSPYGEDTIKLNSSVISSSSPVRSTSYLQNLQLQQQFLQFQFLQLQQQQQQQDQQLALQQQQQQQLQLQQAQPYANPYFQTPIDQLFQFDNNPNSSFNPTRPPNIHTNQPYVSPYLHLAPLTNHSDLQPQPPPALLLDLELGLGLVKQQQDSLPPQQQAQSQPTPLLNQQHPFYNEYINDMPSTQHPYLIFNNTNAAHSTTSLPNLDAANPSSILPQSALNQSEYYKVTNGSMSNDPQPSTFLYNLHNHSADLVMNNDLEFSNASFDSIGGVSVSAAATGAGAGAGDYSHTNITSNFAQTNLHSSSQQSDVLPPPPSLPPPPTSLPSQQSQNQYLDVVPPQQLTNNALKTEANSPLITDSANFTTSQPQFENTILEQSPIFSNSTILSGIDEPLKEKSPNMLNSTLPLSKSTPHHIYQPSSSSSSHVRHNKITKKSSLSRLNTSSKKNLRANLVHSLSTPTELDDANNNNNDIVTPPKTLSPLLRKKTSFINVKKENDIDDSHDINCKNFSIDIDDMDDEDVLSDFSQPPPPIGGVSNDTMRSLAPVGGVGLGSSGNITGYRSLSNASSTSSHGSHHGLPVMNIFRHNPDSTKPSTPSPILSTASSSSTLSNKKVVKKLRGRKSKTKMNKSSIKTEQVVNEEPQVKNYKDDNDNDNDNGHGHDHDDENGGVSSDVGTGSNSTPSTTTKGKKMKLNVDLNNGGGSGTGSGSCSDENTSGNGTNTNTDSTSTSNPMVKKKHTRRRLLPRSKKGCWICRIKHLKCDEVTPICGGCAKFGLQCDYSSEKPAYVTDKILRQEKLTEVSLIRKRNQAKTKISRKKSSNDITND